MANPAGKMWLTTRAASQLLGVSESTIRRWADAGEIRSYRTTGGHRRVLEDDVRQMTAAVTPSRRDSADISDIVVGRVKRRMVGRGRQHAPIAALDGLAPEVRERLRQLGRQLVDLFARYIVAPARADRFTEDARVVGREYGRTLVGAGLRLTAAVTAFNALRGTLEETAVQIATEAGLSTEEAVEALERVLRLADVVLEGMAEVYEPTLNS